MHLHRYGHDALLVEVDDARTALALYRHARERGVVACDIVPAARTVLFTGLRDPDRLRAELAGWTPGASTEPETPVVEVPTRYDGADLAYVARHWDMTVEEAVATHTSVDFVVAFCGFAPGFAYCAGLPAALAVPRHHDPRPRVPAGAVGVAGAFTGVYPTASPGGWRLVGHTDLVLWDAGRPDPATLGPGTRVRFVRT